MIKNTVKTLMLAGCLIIPSLSMASENVLNENMKGKYKHQKFTIGVQAGFPNSPDLCHKYTGGAIESKFKGESKPVWKYHDQGEGLDGKMYSDTVHSCTFELGYFRQCSISNVKNFIRDEVDTERRLDINNDGLWTAKFAQIRSYRSPKLNINLHIICSL